MKKLRYSSLLFIGLSFLNIDILAIKADISVNRGSICLVLGDTNRTFSLRDVSENSLTESIERYNVTLKKKKENTKIKLTDNNGNIIRLLLDQNGNTSLYKTNWNASLNVTSGGNLNLFSHKKKKQGNFFCNSFNGSGSNVYLWGDIYVKNYWRFQGNTVCVAGRLRTKETNDILNTPGKDEIAQLRSDVQRLSRGFWVFGETDVNGLITHNLNTYLHGTLKSPTFSQEGSDRSIFTGEENTKELATKLAALYSKVPNANTAQKTKKITMDVKTLSGAEKITMNAKESTDINIQKICEHPTLDFQGVPDLKGTKNRDQIEVNTQSFKAKIGNVDKLSEIKGITLTDITPPPTKSRGTNLSFPVNSLKDTPATPRGIQNIRNTCFANSALQLLLSSSRMRDVFRSYKGDNAFMLAMKNLTDMWMQGTDADRMRNYIRGEKLRPLVKDIWPEYLRSGNNVDGAQHDSGEFLESLLSSISESSKNNNLPFLVDITNRLKLKEDNTFVGERIEENTLLQIHMSNFSSIDGTESKTLALSNIKKSIFESTDYNLNNKIVTVTGTSVISKFPECLFLSILRFINVNKNGTYVSEKVFTKINIPEILQDGDVTYCLKGVAKHSGATVNSGHYTAYTRFAEDWYCISDSSVNKVSGKSFLENDTNSRILFYEKVAK